jgi:2,3-bisphosphoglycerate-dependent phosphoglycerate mutase
VDLVIVRHGEPVRIVAEEGIANPPLTERGRAQAAATAEWLKVEPIEAIYASPLQRAMQTAEPLAAALGLDVRVADGVAEYDRDSPSYIPYEELKATKDPHFYALAENRLSDVFPEGAEFRKRVCASMDEIITAHPGQRVAVFCHGGVVNVFLAEVLELARDLWFEPSYASISRVAASRGGVRSLVSLNETAHLRDIN